MDVVKVKKYVKSGKSKVNGLKYTFHYETELSENDDENNNELSEIISVFKRSRRNSKNYG